MRLGCRPPPQHTNAERTVGAIFPDGVIDFAFEAQFGEMSAKRCFAVLLEAVTSPVPTTGQASQLSIQPFAPRQGKQRSSPSVPSPSYSAGLEFELTGVAQSVELA